MKKLILSIIAVAISFNVSIAQESNNGKEIWAKSLLNQKAPKIEVEKWVGETPNMDGKFVLLEFWATWCGPCRKAIPKLNEMQKTFKDKLVIIGLTDEPYEMVADWLSPKIEYSSAVDTRKILKDQLAVVGVPHAILISPKGDVIWEGFPLLPGHELTVDVMKSLIEKYSSK